MGHRGCPFLGGGLMGEEVMGDQEAEQECDREKRSRGDCDLRLSDWQDRT
jgi:hypothetical protein